MQVFKCSGRCATCCISESQIGIYVSLFLQGLATAGIFSSQEIGASSACRVFYANTQRPGHHSCVCGSLIPSDGLWTLRVVSLFINLSVSDEAVCKTEAGMMMRLVDADLITGRTNGWERSILLARLGFCLSPSFRRLRRHCLNALTHFYHFHFCHIPNRWTSGKRNLVRGEIRFHLRIFQKYTHCFFSFFLLFFISSKWGQETHTHRSIYMG